MWTVVIGKHHMFLQDEESNPREKSGGKIIPSNQMELKPISRS